MQDPKLISTSQLSKKCSIPVNEPKELLIATGFIKQTEKCQSSCNAREDVQDKVNKGKSNVFHSKLPETHQIKKYTCEVCEKQFDEKYFDVAQRKCILHCNKTEANGWYKQDVQNKKEWDNLKVDLFWSCIHQELNLIAEESVDPEVYTNYKHEYLYVIFPKHQKDHDYDPIKDHRNDLATNFYSYFEYKNREGDVIDIYNIIEKLQLKFINCTFLDVIDLRRYTFKKDVFFFNCTFYKKVLLGNIFSHRLSFKECNFYNNILYLNDKTFEDKVVIKRCMNIKDINLKESTFKSKVKIQSCEIKGNATFYNTKFIDLADFYKTVFNDVDFERTDFNSISIFSESRFNKAVDFKYTKFLGKAIFRDAVFCSTLNIRDSIFDNDALFLGITSEVRKVKDIQVANRETARVIKNFLDNSNNIIEANKFYALEMEEREKELIFKENLFLRMTLKRATKRAQHPATCKEIFSMEPF